MKYQDLFYQKNNEKIFKTVVCCSRAWRFKGKWFKGLGKFLERSRARSIKGK